MCKVDPCFASVVSSHPAEVRSATSFVQQTLLYLNYDKRFSCSLEGKMPDTNRYVVKVLILQIGWVVTAEKGTSKK